MDETGLMDEACPAGVLPGGLVLRDGDWEAELLPEAGAAIARLRWRDHEVLVPLGGGQEPNAAFAGAFLMLPWTNRLDAGQLHFAGQVFQLPVNRPEDNTAIHGLARERPWSVVAREPGSAVLVQGLHDPALPFRYAAKLGVAIRDGRFVLALSVTNKAEVPFPFGMGLHPFFARPDGTTLRLRAGTVFGRDARCLPMAPHASEGIDGDERAWLGFDTHFAGWDGLAEIGWPDAVLHLRATGAWARNAQVFAPTDGSQVLCVEPVSHVPDAPNRPEFAEHGAMTVLLPGETLDARLELTVQAR